MYSGGKSYPTSARGGQCNVQQHHAPNDRHHPRPPKFGAKRQRLEEASSDSNYSQYSPIGRDNDRRELAGDVFAVACQPPTRQNSHHIMTYSSMDNGDHYDDSSLEDKNDEPSVIEKLEDFLLESFFDQLVHDGTTEIPTVPMINTEDKKLSLENIHQCRNLTSILLVASYCHRLLLAGRTTTTREVYYYYVTHFHHQRECEKAIWDLTILLGLSSRLSLGLTSSPKGWFCGSITLYHEQTGEKFLDGRELDTHGAAITPTTYGDSSKILLAEDGWLQALQQGANLGGQQPRRLRLKSDAKCIVVIEKEGVYTRLSEDRIFDGIPCILVTGKGFPDVATRKWVHHLHDLLGIPVVGLCDCNPHGISVLNTYQYQHGVQVAKAQQKRNQRGERNNEKTKASLLHLQWIGLRPSQIETLDLPKSTFQALTTLDKKRLKSFLEEDHPFLQQGWNPKQRRKELSAMKRYKVELEALHWVGMSYLSKFVLYNIDGMLHGCKNSII